jgi:hypothetical protein
MGPRGSARRVKELLDRIEPQAAPNWSRSAVFWANPGWSLVCLLFLLVTVIHPPGGLPVRFCLFHALFGVDCPGCGLTRGIAQLWRGNILSALEYNFFAPLALVYLLLQSAYLFLPVSFRLRAIDGLNRRDSWIRKTWFIGIALFFAYGFLRAFVQLVAF